jgi:hypothetical protein
MIFRTAMIAAIALTAACSDDQLEADKRAQAQEVFRTTNTLIPAGDGIITFPPPQKADQSRPMPNRDRNAYFGDLHVHTTLSFDASAFGTTASPADAYRYAQGEAIKHPGGFEVQMAQPLDFYAVTDHGVFLGLINEAADTSSPISKYDFAEPYHNINESVDGGLLDYQKEAKCFTVLLAMWWRVCSTVLLVTRWSTTSAMQPGYKLLKRLMKPTTPVRSPRLQGMNSRLRPHRVKPCIAT